MIFIIYEKLLEEAHKNNIEVIENVHFESKSKGLIKGNRIALSRTLRTRAEKACILAEELGHYHTTVGNIINMKDIKNRKQEHYSRVWAYNDGVGLIGIVKAFEARCQNRHEIAEFLDVTEDFLTDAIDSYKSKYGISAELDNYIILFEPCLAVMEKRN